MEENEPVEWLEVSLTVNGELAEAAADMLARFAPNGVTTEQAVEFINDEDEGTPSGPITVRAYLEVDDLLDDKQQKLEQALRCLGMIQPFPEPIYRRIADQNWMEAWKARYQPIKVGRRLIIVPAWIDPPEPDAIAIRIDPGMAFGTGTHPTTQLCLEMLEEVMDKTSRRTVMDIGCGSGILSIAALKLGAEFALGVDIDAAAVKASRENADLNSIPVGKFLIEQGSVSEILKAQFQLPAGMGTGPVVQAPLILANILAPVLIRLFSAGLANLVEPGGCLVLSGIMEGQQEGVIAAGEKQGMELVAEKKSGDWLALLMQPAGRG